MCACRDGGIACVCKREALVTCDYVSVDDCLSSAIILFLIGRFSISSEWCRFIDSLVARSLASPSTRRNMSPRVSLSRCALRVAFACAALIAVAVGVCPVIEYTPVAWESYPSVMTAAGAAANSGVVTVAAGDAVLLAASPTFTANAIHIFGVLIVSSEAAADIELKVRSTVHEDVCAIWREIA